MEFKCHTNSDINHYLQMLSLMIRVEYNSKDRQILWWVASKKEGQMSEKRTQPPFKCQLFIKFEEEGQEVPVRVNGSSLDHMLQSISQRETLPQHQVCQDQSGRSTHTHDAVH